MYVPCYTVDRKELWKMDRENVWKGYTAQQMNELNRVNDKYKACLDAGKTERGPG